MLVEVAGRIGTLHEKLQAFLDCEQSTPVDPSQILDHIAMK